MEQLTGIQSLYLQLESGAMPMHASSLTIYDRSTAHGRDIDFGVIQRFIAERANRSPIFRRRLATLPLSLARPYWIDDPGFDVEFHLRHIALPKPGDWRRKVARRTPIIAIGRECYLIEELDHIPGLPRGSFALFTKAHCAALGETLSAQLFAALHELSPDSRASPPKDARYFDRIPTFVDLATRATVDTLGAPLAFARSLLSQLVPVVAFGARTAVQLVTGGSRRGSGAERDLHVPRTRFNGQVTPQRVIDGVRFDLAEAEQMRAQVPRGTVNDVAIAVISGALHRYLEVRLDPPRGDLFAEAPIASRSATKVFGTRTFVDSAIMSIHSDIEDPVERLRSIVAETGRRKAEMKTATGRRQAPATGTDPRGIASDLAQRARLGSRLAPLVNTTISSIRGPDVPLYLAGARLVGYYGFSVVHDLAGLAHVVGYYDGAMTIGVTACRTMLPDPGRYAQCLRDAYAELGAALGVGEGHSASRQRKGASWSSYREPTTIFSIPSAVASQPRGGARDPTPRVPGGKVRLGYPELLCSRSSKKRSSGAGWSRCRISSIVRTGSMTRTRTSSSISAISRCRSRATGDS
jgi:WS/DGAT/MGAT family acyltransferase